MIKAAFGNVLKQYRKGANMTQEALSLQSGVAFRFLQDIEAGNKQPTISTLFKLASALGCTPGDLLDDVYQHWQATGPDPADDLG